MKFNKKNILWDFDGVILDSMSVRDWGFEEIFKEFDSAQVSRLLKYHRENGGLSRYVKIRYFFENILEQNISDTQVMTYANNFSILMKKELISRDNLISDSLTFIKETYNKFNFHIVSGSDQEELRYLCQKLKISSFFLSIEGSPTPKKKLVQNLLEKYNYDRFDTCLIGDSINDYEAAKFNDIDFYGYNNDKLRNIGQMYIDCFKTLAD